MADDTERTLEQVEAEILGLERRLAALCDERSKLDPPTKPGADALADMVAEYGLPGFLDCYCDNPDSLEGDFVVADPVGVFALIENANARVAAIVEECVAAIRALPSGSGE